MNLTDPIADMLTRVRNANAVRKANVRVPYSKLKHQLAEALLRLGYISSIEVEDNEGKKNIIITLKYMNYEPVISALVRESKPGCRQYGSPKTSPKKYSVPQYAVRIWSTSKGILSEQEAATQNVGGELLCTIW